MAKKRIGVFTGGGDCAGLNAAIMAVVKRGIAQGWEMLGVHAQHDGFVGKAPVEKLTLALPWGERIRQGGTFLGAYSNANWRPEFKGLSEDEALAAAKAEVVAGMKRLKFDGLIGTGGNGSIYFSCVQAREAGLPFVGIPKTIDNDTAGTDLSIGFNSAIEECTRAIDNIYWTAAAHRRVMIVEVMGRHAGHLALHAGLASGADAILIPEIPYTVEGIIKRIEAARKAEKREHFIVVCAEGAVPKGAEVKPGGVAGYIEARLAEKKYHVRSMSLGHIQRDGNPLGADRVLAQRFGVKAVDVMAEMLERGEKLQKMVALRGRKIEAFPLSFKHGEETQLVDAKGDRVKTARELGIYMGE